MIIQIKKILLDKSKPIKFAIVGASNTIISFLAYYILLNNGMNYLLANIVAYLLGMFNSYIWNKRWVFEQRTNSIKSFIKFSIINLAVLLLSTTFLYILSNIFLFNKVFAQIITTSILMVLNYYANKLWTFKKK